LFTKKLLLIFWFMQEANVLYCKPNYFSRHHPPYLKPIYMPLNFMFTSSKGFLPSRYSNQNSDCMSNLSYYSYPTHLILLNLLRYSWTVYVMKFHNLFTVLCYFLQLKPKHLLDTMSSGGLTSVGLYTSRNVSG